jgi:predicted alpha-1,2-mannosidase
MQHFPALKAFIFCSLYILTCGTKHQICAQTNNNLPFVNPIIGTGGHGHTFPGAVWPNGMVQLSPDTRIDNSWDGCSGYHYSDSFIYGFSHTHLSGTGIADWCDILLMPTTNNKEWRSEEYKSAFLHKNEKATAGYYEVLLDKHNILAQLTTTPRVGIHQYTFPAAQNKFIVIDLQHRDDVLESEFEIVYPNRLRGYRYSKSWAKNQKIFFDIEFSEPFGDIQFIDNNTINKHPYAKGKKLKAIVQFTGNTKTVGCKVAISGVDNMGAQNNLQEEATHNVFSRYKTSAEQAWKAKLNKIQVYGGSKDDKIKFYTALYHCYVHPSIYNDADGRYRGMNDRIHTLKKGESQYTVLSLWDTYRTLHPLLTIIDSPLTAQLCNTLLRQYEQQKKLAVWELSSNETDCMIAYHSISVLYDAWQKGYKHFNAELALKAMVNTMILPTETNTSFWKYGYVRGDDDAESVSKTLELSYNAWCVAQMAMDVNSIAKASNDSTLQAYCDSIYLEFDIASASWQNIFDATQQHMRPIYNGTWMNDFNPYVVDNNFTEANSWQYTFYVPHQLQALADKMGGIAKLNVKLDALFAAKTEIEGRQQSDITGLIGQYAHGNEPSHHIAWLYSALGNGASTDKYVSQVLKNFYTNAPDGLIGNEDCGQMSAWYVMSSMGLYPICPGNGMYATATPLWDSVIINNGNQKIVLQKNKNAKKYEPISHEAIVTSNKKIALPSEMQSVRSNYPINNVANAVIANATQIFSDSQKIEMTCNTADAHIFYTLDTQEIRMYVEPFYIKNSCTIDFYSGDANSISPHQVAQFYKVPNDVTVTLTSKYNKQYTAGGAAGLIDGLRGKINWRVGFWQGYQYQDFEATVTFTEKKNIKKVGVGFLSDQRAWIFYPTKLEVYVSEDGKNFKFAGNKNIAVPRLDDTSAIQDVQIELSAIRKVKAIKYKAINYGALPKWHAGVGDKAFIFVDEIWWR